MLDYAKAIDIKPDFAEVYHNRGLVHLLNADTKNALADFNKVIEYKPDFDEAYYDRAFVWSHMQDWEKVKLDLNVAKIIGKNNFTSTINADKNIANIEQKHIVLPEDIAEMLTSPQL